jgi:Uma2 family endonuclease
MQARARVAITVYRASNQPSNVVDLRYAVAELLKIWYHTNRRSNKEQPMSAIPKPYLSSAEYLAFERQSESKHEYFRGELFAMSGASQSHVTIFMNTSHLLVGQLKGRSCRAFGADMRVKVSPTGLYTYPDLVVVCGRPRFADKELDTLLNPTVIVEILSKSTEAYDRGEKFAHYRTLDTLTDYLLISQDRALIEHFTRQADGGWLLTESAGLGRSDAHRVDSVPASSGRGLRPGGVRCCQACAEADGGQRGS